MRCRLRRAGENKSSPANAGPYAPSPGFRWLAAVAAVVFTESSMEIAGVPDTVMVAGLKLQAAFVSRPNAQT